MTNVADLVPHGLDTLGDKILTFYGRKPPEYAVYRVGRRVLVHFADVPARARQQRRALAPLAPLRGEIDGLINGWRDGSTHRLFGLDNSEKLISKAARFDRRVGDALVVALEENVPASQLLLARIKDDIINERVAWARFEYLIVAFMAALGVMFVAWLLSALYPSQGTDVAATEIRMNQIGVILILLLLAAGAAMFLFGAGEKWRRFSLALVLALLILPIVAILFVPSFRYDAVDDRFTDAVTLWRGAAAGAVGAFFSIALAIRGRTILTDLLRTSNLMDAVLRITIGFIAGAVLMALIEAGMIDFYLGGADGPESTLALLIAGFVAGFSERLVPDLLAKAGAKPSEPATMPPAPGVHANAPSAPGDPAPQTDGGRAAGAEAGGGPPPESEDNLNEEACVSDIELDDEEVTSDTDLPAATGGVATGPEGEAR